MIAEVVTDDLEATVQLAVGERRETIRAVIDSGFTGSLTLPPTLVVSLDLVWLTRQPGTLADGSTVLFDVYEAVVMWDGSPRKVEVEASETEPLLGMSLLAGHEITMPVVAGGSVTITSLSETQPVG
jgi:clan AA aspartic protease